MAPTPSTGLWSSLGTIDSYIDFNPILDLGHNIVAGKVIMGFLSGEFGEEHMIITANLISLIMCLATSAYVIVSTVNASINFVKGFYYNYAQKSAFSNLLYLYELIIIFMWEIFALVVTIMALVQADTVWKQVEARVAEAEADETGLLTPINGMVAIKVVTLIGVSTLGVVISGLSLGDVADELIGYFDNYDDKTANEGDEKNDSSNKDAPGTAAEQDIGYSHIITTVYSYIVLMAIAVGGFVFNSEFTPLAGDGFTCDYSNLPLGAHFTAKETLEKITNYETCMANIETLFQLEDLNNNGIISRCENAQFLNHMGVSEANADKFSSQYTMEAFKAKCAKMFHHY